MGIRPGMVRTARRAGIGARQFLSPTLTAEEEPYSALEGKAQMSISRKLLIVAPALALALAASSAHALTAPLARNDPPAGGLHDADRLAAAGQFKAAEKAFRAVLNEQRAAGMYPVVALRGLATVAYLRGDIRGAARRLDELAATAAEFGDLETRVNALLDAALLYQELHDRPAVSHRVTSIGRLVQSPALSAQTRDAVTSRIIAK